MKNEKKVKLLVLPAVKNISEVVDKFDYPVDLTEGSLKDLEFIFKANKVLVEYKGINLKEFSFIWLSSSWGSRDLAYAASLYLKSVGVMHTYVEKGTSKITDHMFFALNKIKVPNTLFLSRKKIEKNFDLIGKICGYPLIVKSTKGARGANSILVESDKDLLDKLRKLPKGKKYLLQEFIENDYDWGIMVANGEVVSGEKSYSCLGEFRNNACNGAREVFVDPVDIPENVKNIALETSKALGLSWSRSDIIIDNKTKEPYLLEINRLPGISSCSSEVEGAFQFLSSELEYFMK